MLLGSKCGDQQYKQAVSDLEQACKLDPTNEVIKNDFESANTALKNFDKNKELVLKNETTNKENANVQHQGLESFTTIDYKEEDDSKLMGEVPEITSINE